MPSKSLDSANTLKSTSVKVVVDLIWGLMIIASFTLFLAAIMYSSQDCATIGLMCAGIPVSISMSEAYHRTKMNERNQRFKR